ncbi:MAG: lipopolysaccharide biosynthesis protein [Nitrospirales bacterium]
MTFTRRLVSGTAQLALSNGVVRLLSIVTMPILTTLLSPQAYGLATLLGTIISLVSVLALAGIDVTYARVYHSVQPPNGPVVEHFCWRFAICMALTGVLLAAIVWFIARYFVELDYRLAIILLLGIVLSVTCKMAQTRARIGSKYRAMALTTIAAGLIGAVVSLGIAFWWRQDAVALLLPMLCAYLIPLLLLGAPSVAELMKPSGLVRGQGATLIKIGLAGIVTAPMYWMLSSSDRWFLQYYHGTVAVGIYGIGYNVAVVGMMVNVAVISMWLPEASREYEQDRERAKYTLGRLMSRLLAAMALIWLMAAAAGGDIVRWLADERFHGSAEFVPFIAGGVFFYGASQLAVYGLVLVKEYKWAAYWWFGGGLFCALLNYALVPRYSGLGAAITQSASFAVISIGIFCTSQVKYRIQLDWSRLVTVTSIILVAGLFLALPWHVTAPLSLLMKLPFGIAVASMTAWVIAPDWCVRGKEYVIKTRTE